MSLNDTDHRLVGRRIVPARVILFLKLGDFTLELVHLRDQGLVLRLRELRLDIPILRGREARWRE